MLFNSVEFAIFLPLMLGVYWSLRGASRHRALLAGSLLFYGWWDWRLLGLILLIIATAFICGLQLGGSGVPTPRRRLVLGFNVFVSLVTLGVFKYFDFFRGSLAGAFALVGWNLDAGAVHVILPMGISFYTFQAMSYTVDVYRGARVERSFEKFALYIACFPQLVAGPIMRASAFLPQLSRDTRLDARDVSVGVYRVFRGLFKKMVVADTLALYVDLVFASPGEFTGISAWIALYAYAFQIYMDFSGYCDIAIGVGRLLGLNLAENFDRPYLACSPSEFWRRWHITLSTWLRDYLYIPLGGSRGSAARTVRNLMITMTLGGLWHGAAWTFVAWGVYHGVLLIAERLMRRGRSPLDPTTLRAPERLLRMLLMFHLICLGWLLFRAPDWSTVVTLGANLFDFSGGTIHGLRIAAIVAACAAAHVLPPVRDLCERFARVPGFGQGALAAACMWALLLCGPKSQSFIYFQF